MIEAVYGINEYIKAQVTAGGLSTGKFYPGRIAPMTEETNTFVTYRASLNETYDLFGLKRATIAYTFYNSSFDTLHRVVRLALQAINVEDIQSTSLSEPGVTYQDASMYTLEPGEVSDVDGNEYYFLNAQVRIMYTEA